MEVRVCPRPGCDYAIKANEGTCEVTCDCGNAFCFRCGEESHRPVTCQTLSIWKEKCKDESETANWILSNTKKCPQCSTRIEKSQGCNHMTCFRCGHHFCWLCLGPWSEHSAATGGFYRCNIYQSKQASTDKKETEDDTAKAKRDLDRYLHYYQRYHNHHKAEEFARRQLEGVEKRIDEFHRSSSTSTVANDPTFLKVAVEQIVRCRQVLKYTYVYGYYLNESIASVESAQLTGMRQLFEVYQTQLESFTEHLSGLSEKSFLDINSTEVVNYTRVTAQYLRNLLDGLDDGMVEVMVLSSQAARADTEDATASSKSSSRRTETKEAKGGKGGRGFIQRFIGGK